MERVISTREEVQRFLYVPTIVDFYITGCGSGDIYGNGYGNGDGYSSGHGFDDGHGNGYGNGNGNDYSKQEPGKAAPVLRLVKK